MTGHELTARLNEYFYVGALPLQDQKKYYLIKRYRGKVSNRLERELYKLHRQGQELLRQELKLIYDHNPFLDCIKSPHWRTNDRKTD